MKRLGALLGLYPLVYTKDFDGEVRVRVVSVSPWGGGTVKGVYGQIAQLQKGGTLTGIQYMEAWKEWPRNRKHVVFSEEQPCQ